MTYADLQSEVWRAMPPLRKRIAGREVVDDFVTLAVQNWSGEYLEACADNRQRNVYAAALLGQLKRGHQAVSGAEPTEYGFLWVFLLQAVAAAVIEWLIKWWLDRRANRVLLAGWQQEMTA
jgi:hypothetical protein